MNQYTDVDQFDFKLIISLYRKCENQEYVNLVNVNQEYVENQENQEYVENQENGNQENQENINHGNQENHVNHVNVNLTICTV